MGMGRSTKIIILLVIDVAFFFVELVTGFAVNSLALIADSFHMLNDVMSLVVALYAIRLTNSNAYSPEYSYGWHRAEILAALINGVFLLALCFSIFIEAIERFFKVPEVGNPKLVVIVGSLGLMSNIVGLFLFHEHGHSHGPGDTSPVAGPKTIPDASATPTDLSPLLPSEPAAPVAHVATPGSPPVKLASPTALQFAHRRSDSINRAPALNRRLSDSNNGISIHPAQVRASLVQVAEDLRAEGEGATSPEPHPHSPHRRKSSSIPRPRLSSSAPGPNEGGTLEDVLSNAYNSVEEGRPPQQRDPGRRNDMASDTDEDDEEAPITSAVHAGHSHSHGDEPKRPGGGGSGHGHSHGSMNMRAVLLHVIGDALGNVGVIATGLIIWLSEWEYKFYCDPVISLVITAIIFTSAFPLVKSASFILLQGVPNWVSLEEVRSAILAVPGVISVHELHIWQLSESKLVASVHVLVRKSRRTPQNGSSTPNKDKSVKIIEPNEENGEYIYMTVASEIRKVLHDFGIHSSTIQPEYVMDGVDDDAISVQSGCLIPCTLDAECDPANACCPPVVPRSVE